MIKLILFIFSCLVVLQGFAQTKDSYQFQNADQQLRFVKLTQQFRCLVCQNEALADSNASLAQDLRREISHMILQGTSDQQITNYLVQRYGSYVLFQPPLQKSTYLLWFGPFGLLILAGILLIVLVRSRQGKLR